MFWAVYHMLETPPTPCSPKLKSSRVELTDRDNRGIYIPLNHSKTEFTIFTHNFSKCLRENENIEVIRVAKEGFHISGNKMESIT